jgi:hypothetical protein
MNRAERRRLKKENKDSVEFCSECGCDLFSDYQKTGNCHVLDSGDGVVLFLCEECFNVLREEFPDIPHDHEII